MSEHTQEPWRLGNTSSVVADEPVIGMNGSDAVEYYGGHLICESVVPSNARRIVACVNACAGMDDPADAISMLKSQRDELLAEVGEWRAIKSAYLIEYAARPNAFHPGQYHGHAHDIDGIWDRDNGVLAGCKCVACMVHRAAIASAEKPPCA